MNTFKSKNSNNSERSGSLSNLRILDLTRVWAGPLATRTLADFGAEVIKISDPRVPLDSASRVNNKLNRNKYNIGIRLDQSKGKQVFLDLVAISDVVIENYRPRVMKNLDLTYKTLCETNPNLIMCSMPGFGLDGPYSEYPAFGSTAEAVSGASSLIGYDPKRPLQTGMSYADPISGLNSVWSVMAYARERVRSGQGAYIDIALSESPLGALGEFIAASSLGAEPPLINGNKHPQHCPHDAFPTKEEDKWITIAVRNLEEWNGLKQVYPGNEFDDPKLNDAKERKNSELFINNAISNWTINHPRDELVQSLQKCGVPAGPVLNNRELLENKHLKDKDYFVNLKEKNWGEIVYDGQSVPGNQRDKVSWHAMREVGEDSLHIIRNLLGYTEQEFDDLVSSEAIGSD